MALRILSSTPVRCPMPSTDHRLHTIFLDYNECSNPTNHWIIRPVFVLFYHSSTIVHKYCRIANIHCYFISCIIMTYNLCNSHSLTNLLFQMSILLFNHQIPKDMALEPCLLQPSAPGVKGGLLFLQHPILVFRVSQ